MSIQEDNLGPGGHGKDLPVLAELAATNLLGHGEAPDFAPGGGVPHADGLVVAAGDELLVVRGVHHLLDPGCVPLKLDDGFAWLLQVENPKNLVVARGGEGGAVVAKVDTLDNMLVLQGELLLARQSIPNLKSEH